MALPWRRRLSVPAVLAAALQPDEQIQALAPLAEGGVLGVSRFGLWLLENDVVVRWDWQSVSKARLSGGTLVVISAGEEAVTAGGIVLLRDLPPREFRFAGQTGLTDAVHTRVRRSVAASRHLPWPGAGGWVVLRRVPGRNGLTTQVRLDPGADADADGFLAAAARVADELRGDVSS